jgi:hypothetical protein
MILIQTYKILEDDNLFSANIGNIPPSQEVLIGIIYVIELDFEGKQVNLLNSMTNSLNLFK